MVSGGRRRTASLVAIGLTVGLLSGLMGVGGGIVMVPLLVLVAGFAQHRAHATSLAAIVPIAAVAATRFAIDGEVAYRTGVLLALGALAGAPVGARLLARLDEGTLKNAFGALMVAVGVILIWP
jgi:uncharacterized membrane protein YfcA